ncbi:MAG: hypothetical protein CMP24_04485 [Rickettsiales bacterium]|nr:hypothetical protein [Rickettsiales bacterium]
MPAKKKRYNSKQKKKLINKKKTPNTKNNFRLNFDYKNSSLFIFSKMIINFPYIFINKLVSILINIVLAIYTILKQIFIFSFKIKEAVFGIVFGVLSGSIAAVIVYSYMDMNSDINKTINEQNIADNSVIKEQLKVLDRKISNIILENEANKVSIDKIDDLETQVFTSINNTKENLKNVEAVNQRIENVINNSEKIRKEINELEQNIINNSKLMLSSSKTELSNRLYLAQSLVDRLKSGVPYAPQLVALGEEGLNPALLRYAKGGAPTLADLAARLSVRAGELRDADKTKRDVNWRDNLRSEISKYVKIKPTDINSIQGTPGALLRAEDAISKGNLKKAIKEVDSLIPKDRGVLNAWLSEAKARQNANIAAENLLAKTTAALRKRN